MQKNAKHMAAVQKRQSPGGAQNSQEYISSTGEKPVNQSDLNVQPYQKKYL